MSSTKLNDRASVKGLSLRLLLVANHPAADCSSQIHPSCQFDTRPGLLVNANCAIDASLQYLDHALGCKLPNCQIKQTYELRMQEFEEHNPRPVKRKGTSGSDSQACGCGLCVLWRLMLETHCRRCMERDCPLQYKPEKPASLNGLRYHVHFERHYFQQRVSECQSNLSVHAPEFIPASFSSSQPSFIVQTSTPLRHSNNKQHRYSSPDFWESNLPQVTTENYATNFALNPYCTVPGLQQCSVANAFPVQTYFQPSCFTMPWAPIPRSYNPAQNWPLYKGQSNTHGAQSSHQPAAVREARQIHLQASTSRSCCQNNKKDQYQTADQPAPQEDSVILRPKVYKPRDHLTLPPRFA